MFGRKKKTRLQQVQKAVQQTQKIVGARAHDLTQNLTHTAHDTLSSALDHAPEKIEDLKHAAGEALSSASETLHEAASRMAGAAQNAASVVGARAETLKGKAETLRGTALHSAHDGLGSVSNASSNLSSTLQENLHERADAIATAARKMKKQRTQQVEEISENAQRTLKKKKEEVARAYVPEVVIESSGEKWLWLLVGIGVGAALGILLAPNAGRRTRAVLKDKLERGPEAAGELGENLAHRAHNLSQRASGLAHEISKKHSGDGSDDMADDVTIADRVRTELGRFEKEHGLERINVDSCDGVVTLRGPVGEQSIADTLVQATAGVLGVREVKNELATEGKGESFVG